MEKLNLDQIKANVEELASQWNGDESGKLEDQTHLCQDILEAIKNLEELLLELEQN